MNNQEDLCDEEKSYHEWFTKNSSFANQWKHIIHIIEKIYKDGFAAGFVHREKINAMEQLQK